MFFVRTIFIIHDVFGFYKWVSGRFEWILCVIFTTFSVLYLFFWWKTMLYFSQRYFRQFYLCFVVIFTTVAGSFKGVRGEAGALWGREVGESYDKQLEATSHHFEHCRNKHRNHNSHHYEEAHVK